MTNILLQPIARAVLFSMSTDSSISVGGSSPRLSRLWLSLIRYAASSPWRGIVLHSWMLVLTTFFLFYAQAGEQEPRFDLKGIQWRSLSYDGKMLIIEITGPLPHILTPTNSVPPSLKHQDRFAARHVRVIFGPDVVGIADVSLPRRFLNREYSSVTLTFESEEQVVAATRALLPRSSTPSPLHTHKEKQ